MSPAEVRLLLHIYAIAEPLEHPNSPVSEDAIEEWLENGIIEMCASCKSGYRTTARGSVWVKMICDTPVPVMIWVDPRTQEKK